LYFFTGSPEIISIQSVSQSISINSRKHFSAHSNGREMLMLFCFQHYILQPILHFFCVEGWCVSQETVSYVGKYVDGDYVKIIKSQLDFSYIYQQTFNCFQPSFVFLHSCLTYLEYSLLLYNFWHTSFNQSHRNL
jgi:hypothetical protein